MEDSESKHQMSVQTTDLMQSTIPSAPNLPNVGDHVARDGRRVCIKLLYRSEQLSGITEADMPVFELIWIKLSKNLHMAGKQGTAYIFKPEL
jgi:hypothetical protein